MPEATVDEDDGSVLGKDDIRGARESLDVNTITEAVEPEDITQA